MWLNMQHAVDLWEAGAVHGHEYKKIQHSDGWRTGHHTGWKGGAGNKIRNLFDTEDHNVM
jgi:hypothetical protein